MQLSFLKGEIMKCIDVIASILLVLGGLNWGLIGIANFNFVTWLFGMMPLLVHIIYILVGLSAIWKLVQCKAIQGRWCCKK